MHSNIENCYFLELGTQGVKFSDAIENDDNRHDILHNIFFNELMIVQHTMEPLK